MDQYEAAYAADMRAIANLQACETIGCEFRQVNGSWQWCYRGQTKGRFDDKDEAAYDFLQSDHYRAWLRSHGVYV